MKKYISVLTMICVFAVAGISGAAAQEAKTANPASDFKFDLTSDGKGVIIKKYKGESTDVVIPAVIEDFPVVEVEEFAFCKTSVISVVFPDSITEIGSCCFRWCESLSRVVLPKNLKFIDDGIFCECSALKKITLPDGIKFIGAYAFQNSGLESIEIPDSVIVIEGKLNDQGAFASCKNLKTVNIGKGIKCIETRAFNNCQSLTTVNIGVNMGEVKHREDSSIYFHGKFYIPGYGDNVFAGCSSLSLKEQKKIRDTGYTSSF